MVTRPAGGSAVQVRLGTLDELLEHGRPLFEEHWHEVGKHKDVLPLAPDEGRYRAFDAADQLTILLAFDGSLLIGYSVSTFGPHAQSREQVVCATELVFVTKAMRGAGIGLQLLRRTSQMAGESGAQVQRMHAKPGSDLDRLLPALGFSVLETVYEKVL